MWSGSHEGESDLDFLNISRMKSKAPHYKMYHIARKLAEIKFDGLAVRKRTAKFNFAKMFVHVQVLIEQRSQTAKFKSANINSSAFRSQYFQLYGTQCSLCRIHYIKTGEELQIRV